MENEFLERLGDNEQGAMKMDGYDFCIIGISTDGLLVYSKQKILDSLMECDEMDETGAIDWYEYNIVRSLGYAGEMAPIICEDV